MQKESIIAAIIGVLVLVVIAQGLQLNSLNSKLSSFNLLRLTSAGSGAIDKSGWTANEIMNYQMHGIIPARAGVIPQPGATQSVPSQVGGC